MVSWLSHLSSHFKAILIDPFVIFFMLQAKIYSSGVEPASYGLTIRYYFDKNYNDKELTKYDHRH